MKDVMGNFSSKKDGPVWIGATSFPYGEKNFFIFAEEFIAQLICIDQRISF